MWTVKNIKTPVNKKTFKFILPTSKTTYPNAYYIITPHTIPTFKNLTRLSLHNHLPHNLHRL